MRGFFLFPIVFVHVKQPYLGNGRAIHCIPPSPPVADKEGMPLLSLLR